MPLGLDDIHKNAINHLKHSSKWNKFIDLLKDCSDANPHSKKSNEHVMWEEQANINIPLMYLASIYLYHYTQEKKCTTFLFATRDCCHWHRIFKAMYPNEKVYYFHCSKKVFEDSTSHHNSAFKSYVNSVVKNIDTTIFIDIHGTGKRMFNYFDKEFHNAPYCFLLSSTFSSYSDFPKLVQHYKAKHKLCNLIFDSSGSPIEMLNYDKIGTLVKYTSSGPERNKLEYDYKIIKPYHKSMKYAINHIKPVDTSINHSYEELRSLIEKIYKCIKKDEPNVMKYIKHERTHKKK